MRTTALGQVSAYYTLIGNGAAEQHQCIDPAGAITLTTTGDDGTTYILTPPPPGTSTSTM